MHSDFLQEIKNGKQMQYQTQTQVSQYYPQIPVDL